MSAGASLVLFDFDGTLVRGDCVGRFLVGQIRRSRWRRLAALPLLPLLPLLGWWRSAWIAASAFSWLASVGRSEAQLRIEAERYIAHLAAQPERWLIAPAVERLRGHLAKGDPVMIITGASEPMARALWSALVPELATVTLLGSQTRRLLGGQVAAEHCIGGRKLQRLARLGLRPPFAAMYSDSPNDLPLLSQSRHAVVVAPTAANLRRLQRRLGTFELIAD